MAPSMRCCSACLFTTLRCSLGSKFKSQNHDNGTRQRMVSRKSSARCLHWVTTSCGRGPDEGCPVECVYSCGSCGMYSADANTVSPTPPFTNGSYNSMVVVQVGRVKFDLSLRRPRVGPVIINACSKIVAQPVRRPQTSFAPMQQQGPAPRRTMCGRLFFDNDSPVGPGKVRNAYSEYCSLFN
jgi:hypothetical protein